jgi:type IV secretory pathway VirB6-like protein
MQRGNLLRKMLSYALCFFLVAPTLLLPQSAYAVFDAPRENITFNTDANRCDTGSVPFDPLTDNRDYNFELTNTYCMIYIGGVGATLLAIDQALKPLCKATNPTGALLNPSEELKDSLTFPLPYPTPTLLIRIANKVSQCASRGLEFSALNTVCAITLAGSPACAGAVLAAKDTAYCCTGLGVFLAAVAASIGALSITWKMAQFTYENGRICGHDWKKWELQDGIWKKVKGPHHLCLENLFLSGTSNPNVSGSCVNNDSRAISNISYREFIYGGVEFEDDAGNACKNPITWDSARKMSILGYDSANQRYYMTGAGEASVYACYRYLSKASSEEDQAAMQASYDCCKRRSQNTVCVENRSGFGDIMGSYDHSFCEIGSRCTVANIVFEAYESRTQQNYGCVKTYSVCPYNHLLAGGTEKKEFQENDQTVVKNFCQFMNHCSKLPILPYIYTTNLKGGYISQSCRDMKGDSQNVYGYTSQLLPINTRGFSAPLVQCFKETMENIFLHKAGYTQCTNPDEKPVNNECVSGYFFKKGEDLPGRSFFLRIQDTFQSIVKIALTASIIAFGFAILLAVPGAYITKKVLFGYVLKIGLIMYFAVGDAWQFGFIQGVLGTSQILADITFKVDENKPTNKLDGCQFPRFNYADSNPNTKYDAPQYAPTKGYLRIWDTLDCKIAMALGFGPEVSVPNLVLSIVGGLFTGGLGLIFFVAAFVFAFFLISMTIKAMHIFIMSITSVIILLYVSPLTITCAFFKRTEGIFSGWWKQMLGFTLQPMILFAYLGILVSLLDAVILGSATFKPTTVELNGTSVVDTFGRVAPKQISCAGDAANDSIYCIFQISDIKTFNGFEILGIGIPLLGSMNSSKLETIMKCAIIMFIFSSFMDKMSGFAAKLVGGAELKSTWGSSTSKLAGQAYGALSAVQSRGVRALKKHGMGLGKKVDEGGKKQVRDISGSGRSLGKNTGKNEDDTASSNGKLKLDSTESSSSSDPDDTKLSGSGGSADDTSGRPAPEVPPTPELAPKAGEDASASSGGSKPDRSESSA